MPNGRKEDTYGEKDIEAHALCPGLHAHRMELVPVQPGAPRHVRVLEEGLGRDRIRPRGRHHGHGGQDDHPLFRRHRDHLHVPPVFQHGRDEARQGHGEASVRPSVRRTFQERPTEMRHGRRVQYRRLQRGSHGTARHSRAVTVAHARVDQEVREKGVRTPAGRGPSEKCGRWDTVSIRHDMVE